MQSATNLGEHFLKNFDNCLSSVEFLFDLDIALELELTISMVSQFKQFHLAFFEFCFFFLFVFAFFLHCLLLWLGFFTLLELDAAF